MDDSIDFRHYGPGEEFRRVGEEIVDGCRVFDIAPFGRG
jgi:hypothetical protein